MLGTGLAGTAQAGLVNGSLEMLSVAMPVENYIITDATNVPGWQTTAVDNQIEVWESPGPDLVATPADDGVLTAHATRAAPGKPVATGSRR